MKNLSLLFLPHKTLIFNIILYFRESTACYVYFTINFKNQGKKQIVTVGSSTNLEHSR